MKIQILTTPNCSGCNQVKKMLDEENIKYESIDITKNPALLQKYLIMSAPGIVINNKLEFVGVPNKKELMKKLGKN